MSSQTISFEKTFLFLHTLTKFIKLESKEFCSQNTNTKTSKPPRFY